MASYFSSFLSKNDGSSKSSGSIGTIVDICFPATRRVEHPHSQPPKEPPGSHVSTIRPKGCKRAGFVTKVSSNFKKVVIPKQASESQRVQIILKRNFLFTELPQEQIEQIVEVMVMQKFDAGKDIVKQGDKGEHFYVLVSGSCDVYVHDKLIAEYTDAACFGELALVYNVPRAATVRTSTSCTVYSLDVRSFRSVLSEQTGKGLDKRLEICGRVPIFEKLDQKKLQGVAQALEQASFADGHKIIEQGAYGDAFYIIESGSVSCQRKGVGREAETLTTLGPNDFFGELALLDNSPRHATCVAVGPVACLVLDRTQFHRLLGPLQDLIETHSMMTVLRSVALFGELTDAERQAIAEAMTLEKFAAGAEIIQQGDASEKNMKFYVLQTGTASVVKNGAAVSKVQAGAFFGERALVESAPRAASVQAVDACQCQVLDRAAFQRLVMPTVGNRFEEEMERRRKISKTRRASSYAEKQQAYYDLWQKPPFSELTVLRMLGQGTFGRVKLVEHQSSDRVFSLKCMSKAQLAEQKQAQNVRNERDLLYECASPFVLKLYATYQSPNELFLLMELIQGGELWQYMYEKKHLMPRTCLGGFENGTAQFFAACVTSALRYVHNKGIAYRDLKPENLLLDAKGFLKLIDFGFAKQAPFTGKDGKSCPLTFTLCGTPEYIAPEILLSKGHDKAVDCWALGCLIYELLVSTTPFIHEDQQQIFRAIVRAATSLKFPSGFDSDAKALCKGLLNPSPTKRLGALKDGLKDVEDAKWFTASNFDWAALQAKNIKAPYKPPVKHAADVSNIDECDEQDKAPHFNGSQSLFADF